MALHISYTYLRYMNNGLRVTIEEKGNGTIIIVIGQLTRATFKKLEYLFNELIFDNISYCALNLKDLTYVDAKGLEVISKFMTTLSNKRISLFAFGMNTDIFDILDSVDFAQGLKLINTEIELAQAFKGWS